MNMIRNSEPTDETLYTESPRRPSPDSLDALLAPAEIARLLRVPVSWVYERTRRHGIDRIPHFKLGKYLRFSKEEVFDWIQKIRRK